MWRLIQNATEETDLSGGVFSLHSSEKGIESLENEFTFLMFNK